MILISGHSVGKHCGANKLDFHLRQTQFANRLYDYTEIKFDGNWS